MTSSYDEVDNVSWFLQSWDGCPPDIGKLALAVAEEARLKKKLKKEEVAAAKEKQEESEESDEDDEEDDGRDMPSVQNDQKLAIIAEKVIYFFQFI